MRAGLARPIPPSTGHSKYYLENLEDSYYYYLVKLKISSSAIGKVYNFFFEKQMCGFFKALFKSWLEHWLVTLLDVVVST